MSNRNRNRNRSRQGATYRAASEAGATLPADHLAAAEAQGAPIAVRWRRWDLTILPEALDDYEALDAFHKGLPGPLLEAVVPDEKVRGEILESLRDDRGTVRLTSVITAVGDILQKVGAGN